MSDVNGNETGLTSGANAFANPSFGKKPIGFRPPAAENPAPEGLVVVVVTMRPERVFGLADEAESGQDASRSRRSA